ncbi:MAG: TonB family protein [Longimicrobiales bacterium]
MTSAVAWFLYCTFVAGLLGLAALAGEGAARSASRPGRLLWFLAMLASVTIPGVAYFGPDTWSPPLPGFSDGSIPPIAMISVAAPAAGPWSIERIALLSWIAMSSGLVLYLVRSYRRLHAARRSWRRQRLNGVDVWMTPDIGPAVFGVGEASILMPAWALELDERLRRLMLLHEEEHARAGDPQLVLAALLVLIAMPWNVVLWWQLRRLRMAVEVDCDGRVLRREPDRRRYGTLLLEVGRRRGGSSLVVAFAEPRAFLERRIRHIVERSARNVRRAISLAVIAFSLFAVALCARDPQPVAAASVDALLDAVADNALREVVLAELPVVAPYTVEPELVNPDEVRAALRESYAQLLRDAAPPPSRAALPAGGESDPVDAGTPAASSNDLAAAATKTARSGPMSQDAGSALPRGTLAAHIADPAAQRTVMPVKITAPVTTPRPWVAEQHESPAEPPPVRARLTSLAAGPRFTPYTQKPALLNSADIARALRRHYPPQLRDSGIGGTTLVWFLIDETGDVESRQVHQTSGHHALDEAALSVADQMRFAPAENQGETVPVWVQIPIKFASR